MRRIQLYMDEGLDDRLEAEAAGRGVSKASLIREAVAARYGAPAETDPMEALIGAFGGEPAPSVDDVVYG